MLTHNDKEIENLRGMKLFKQITIDPSTILIRVPNGWVLNQRHDGTDYIWTATFIPENIVVNTKFFDDEEDR